MRKQLIINNTALIIIFIVSYFLINSIPSIGDQTAHSYLEKMNNLQAKAVDILIETNKLLISLSLLTIGVFGSLIVRKYEITYTNSSLLRIFLFAGLATSCISIYFGYKLYGELTYMMSYNFYDIDNQSVIKLRNNQFICFLITVLLGVFYLVNHAILIDHEKKQ